MAVVVAAGAIYFFGEHAAGKRCAAGNAVECVRVCVASIEYFFGIVTESELTVLVVAESQWFFVGIDCRNEGVVVSDRDRFIDGGLIEPSRRIY